MKRFLFKKHLFLPLVCALFAMQGWGQNVSITASGATTNFNNWAGTLPAGYATAASYKGTSATSTTGGTYSTTNGGFGWRASSSATSCSLAGSYQNNTGATITSLKISYDAFTITPFSPTQRTPNWTVTSSLGTVTALSWTNSASATPAAPNNMTVTLTGLNLANGATFTITFASDRGGGAGSSPLIGLNNVAIDLLPTVTTTAISGITSTGASSGGNVTSDGGATVTERGIVYGSTTNPTTGNTKVTATGTTGSFTSALSGLTASATYHVRAYAINSVGTSYGSDVPFTTLAPAGSSATDYFRSAQSGNWGDAASWQSSADGSTNWIAATLAPDNNSAGITIQNSHNITVAANVAADNLVVAAGGTLTVSGGGNLTINNGSATDLDIFGTLNNSGVIIPTNASIVVEAGGAFNCLSASPITTGAIGNVGTGSIIGTVTVQQNLSAQRAYRLLGHPFNGNVAISNITPYVDITGSGSGLTAGNASAFNYLTGAWTAYTDNTQTWNKNEALFLFVRGTPGQGIGQTTGTYTPSAPTLSLSGSVNVGDLDYTVRSVTDFGGTVDGWNAIGNPYAAPIDVNAISGITGPGGSGASIYVWNATMGSTNPGIASGGYDFQTLGSNFVIPAYGAFFIKNTSGINQVITFRESNKSFGTPVYEPFGAGNTTTQSFLLTIADSLTYWDKLKISLGDQFNTASTDRLDMDKFSNINLDFYSIASDNKHLAINNRPVLQSATDVIALGLKTNQQRTFTVKASEVNLATGSNLYLHDKYTNSWMKIANDMSYNFSVTADTTSQGNNRFEVAAKAEPVLVSAPAALTVQAGPSPVNGTLTITYASPEALPTNIRITDISGKTVASINAGKVQSGTQQVAAGTWNSGVYVIQVNNGKEVVTKKVVKE